jgi:hypothetical protein
VQLRSCPITKRFVRTAAGVAQGLFPAASQPTPRPLTLSPLRLQIQHTLREPPPNDATMKRVVRTAFGIAMGLYVATGTAGYIAIGDSVGADILVEFEESPNVSK